MKRRVHTIWALLTSAMTALTGCRPQQPFYIHEDGDLSHYIDVATEIDYPDVKTEVLPEVTEALAPMTLNNTKFSNPWELTLEECVKTALGNAKAMRSLGGRYVSSAFNNRSQTGEAPDAITTSPDNTRTVYDPAQVETTPFSGVEHALSAFDAQWTTNLLYQKNDRQQNVRPTVPISTFFRQIFQQDTSTFNTQISKFTAQGGQFTVRNNITYDFNNNPTRQIAKDWNINYEASFNQPLLAGAGAEFNRIAGPFNPFSQIVGGAQLSQQFDGVLLARINVDVSLADFELGVRNLVSDTEQAYWELSFAYRNLETSNLALASARQTWRKIFLLYRIGTKGGEAKEEAQAREQYFQFKATTQTLLNELYRAENRLRYIMGLTVTDGRLIVPIERPTVAKVEFDWREIREEALARSLDLRRQKWRIKTQELSLIAAKNLLMPRLDMVGTYRWLGLGDTLVGANPTPFNPNNPFALTGSSALQTLATGQFQEWNLGVNMTMPLGFRKEMAQVRFYQIGLAKERAKLQDLELEVSHQLADAVRQLQLNYELTQTNFNRTLAADRQVTTVEAAYEAEVVTLDQLLEAQRRRAEAQTSFYRTLLDYQRALMSVHFRKGSLLEYNNVYLTEGPWPAKAQFDAHRLARQRDASLYINYGYTRPSVMSQGAIDQFQDQQAPQQAYPEQVPHLAPVPGELPAPANELPSPEMAEPMAAKRPLRQAPSRVASAVQRGFEWGPLGLDPKQSDEEDAVGRGLADGLRAAQDSSVPVSKPAAVAASSTKFVPRATVKSTHDARQIDRSVRQVNLEEPSANRLEPDENQSSGATSWSAAGRSGR